MWPAADQRAGEGSRTHHRDGHSVAGEMPDFERGVLPHGASCRQFGQGVQPPSTSAPRNDDRARVSRPSSQSIRRGARGDRCAWIPGRGPPAVAGPTGRPNRPAGAFMGPAEASAGRRGEDAPNARRLSGGGGALPWGGAAIGETPPSPPTRCPGRRPGRMAESVTEAFRLAPPSVHRMVVELDRFTPLRSHRPVAGRDGADGPGRWLAASPAVQGNRQDAKTPRRQRC